jgi:hypothetical protein
VGATTAKNYFSTQTTADVELFKNMTAAATLRIGNPSVSQSCHVGNIDLQQNTINHASAPTSGVINIGNRQTAASGLINIGTNASRSTLATIKIGHTTTDVQCSNLLLSSQSIDNASSVSNGTLFIGFGQSAGAGTLNLGTALNRTGAVNIASGANVANTSAINLSSTASTGIINVNRPLTANYNPLAITAGSSNLQIGNRYEAVSNLSGSTSASANTNASVANWTLAIGVWICECNFFVNSGFINQFEYCVGTSPTVTVANTLNGTVTTSAGGVVTRSTCVIVNTTPSQTYHLVTKSATVSVPLLNIYINLTRIA